MADAQGGISLHTPNDDLAWYRSERGRIWLADALDSGSSDSMSVGFAHYDAGEANEWVVGYDEAVVVVRGSFTVVAPDGRETTAGPGEVIFLRKGTELTYTAKDGPADVVYVTYPHWLEAQQASEHAALVDTFQPTAAGPDGAA